MAKDVKKEKLVKYIQNIGIKLVKIEDNNENSKNKRLKTRIVDD